MASQEPVGSSGGISIQNNVVPTTRRPRILLAASGSVAEMKFQVLRNFLRRWADTKTVVTKTFLQLIDTPSMPDSVSVYVDDTEWRRWKKSEYKMFHDVLCEWADVMVIAPLSTNTLGKIALGLSDDLLTSIVGAWDFSNKQLVVAPSMDTSKGDFDDTLTQEFLRKIESRGVLLVMPPTTDASGDSSADAMAKPSSISALLLVSLVSNGWKILS